MRNKRKENKVFVQNYLSQPISCDLCGQGQGFKKPRPLNNLGKNSITQLIHKEMLTNSTLKVENICVYLEKQNLYSIWI